MSIYIFYWLFPLLAVVIALMILLVYAMLGVSSADLLANLFQGGTKLTCWHCGQETRSDLKTCQHCGKELQ